MIDLHEEMPVSELKLDHISRRGEAAYTAFYEGTPLVPAAPPNVAVEPVNSTPSPSWRPRAPLKSLRRTPRRSSMRSWRG